MFLHVFCEGLHEKRKRVCVERDYRAAISNSFCFAIQERFGMLENAEDTQTGLIDGEYEL